VALALAVAASGLLIVVGGDDSLARTRYRLVFDQAKRECTGLAVIDANSPGSDGTTQWSGGVQFVVQPPPGAEASDQRAFDAGCRAGAFKRPS
jgi:hypothetical protein